MKKGKILIAGVLCTALMLCSALLLTACGGGKDCVHKWGDWSVGKAATCLEKGEKERSCSKCKEKETAAIDATGHSFSTGWTSDGNDHWHAATCPHTDEVKDKAAHTWDQGVITTPATDVGGGVKTFTCTVCEKTKTEEIPATGHTFSETWTSDENNHWHAATCTHIDEVKDKAAHTYDNGTLTTAATCTEKGVKTYACTVCEKTKTEELPLIDHEMEVAVTNATCTTQGQKVSACKHCDYEITEIINVLGHTWNIPAPTCTLDQVCSACGALTPKTGHDWREQSQEAATCTVDGSMTYACGHCNETYEEITQTALGHEVHNWTLANETLMSGQTCKYEQTYEGTCKLCGETERKTETAEKHTYKSSITKAATCTTDGVMTYSCSGCTHSYTKSFSDPDAHVWDEGTLKGTVTEYHCTENGCVEVKTAISAKDQKDTTVTSDILSSVGEVELQEAVIKLDSATSSGLSGDINIGADTLSGETLDDIKNKLTPEQLAQLKDNSIYNFTMTQDGTPVTAFGGKVTVRIPYTLAEGDDPECIAVWYIESDGSLTQIMAKYSSGFAVFETDHFSYYTVTRLTPAERCALYGHSHTDTVYEPTCVSKGYTLRICTRCGKSAKIDVVNAKGHDLDQTTVAATCTVDGQTVSACKNCAYTQTLKLRATGHDWAVTETVAATCTKAGYVKNTCSHCHDVYMLTVAQKKHNVTFVVTAPTCLEKGYTTHTCKDCPLTYKDTYKPAEGHRYTVLIVAPTCTDEGYTNHVCTGCGDAYKTDKVSARHTFDIDAPTCAQGQQCVVCKAAGLPATGLHDMVDGHCAVCGEGCTHNYTVTKVESTCTEKGYTLKVCSICHTQSKSDYTLALGHVGEFDCTRCHESIMPDKFLETAFESLLNQPFTIKLTDFELEMNGGTLKLHVNELFVALDKNMSVSAQGYGVISQIFDGKTSVLDCKIVIKDEMVYFSAVGNFNYSSTKTDDYSFMIPLSTALTGNDQIGTILNMLPSIIDWYETDVKAMIENILALNKSEIDKCLTGLTEFLFQVKKNSDGYTLSIDYNAIKDLHVLLSTKTFEQLVELVMGEDMFDPLTIKLISLSDKKMSEVLAELKKYGLDVDTLLSAADSLVSVISGGQCTRLEDFIYMITQTEIGDIGDLIKSQEFLNMTLGELIAQMSGMPIESMKVQIKEMMDSLKNLTFYEIVAMLAYAPDSEMADVIKDTVEQYLELLKTTTALSFSTDSTGRITSITVGVEKNPALPFTGELSFVANYLSTADYDTLVNELQQYKNLLKVEDFLKVDQMQDAVYDDKGNLTGFTVSNNYSSILREIKEKDYIIREIEENISETVYDLNGYGIWITKDCGNWVSFKFLTNVEKYESRTVKCVYLSYDGEVLGEEIIDQKETLPYTFLSTLDFFYNTKTGQKEFGLSENLHQYKVDEELSIEAVGCTGEGEIHYYCAECGDTYIEYYTNGHNRDDVSCEYIFDQEKDCEQGVTVIDKCKECGEEIGKREHYAEHQKRSRNQVDLTGYDVCKDHDLVLSSCACGKEMYFETDGKFDWQQVPSDQDKNGLKEIGSCYKCNLRIEKDFTQIESGCQMTRDVSITVMFDKEIIDQFAFKEVFENHRWQTFVSLMPGSMTCNEGIFVSQVCTACGKREKEREEKGHTEGITEQIDLKKYGAHEGALIHYGCACGEARSFWQIEGKYEPRNEQDGEKRITTYTFLSDGFVVRFEESETKKGCVTYNVQDILIGYQENDSSCLDRRSSESKAYEAHDLRMTAELSDGAKTCEDGVIITETCKNCGYNENHIEHNHRTTAKEEIDLAQYGNVCGGKISILSCACGAENGYKFQEKCEFGSERVWLESEAGYQDTYLDVYTCAVTDPVQCTFSYAIKTMTKVEGCEWQTYIVLMIGYERETGTAQRTLEPWLQSVSEHHTMKNETIESVDQDGNRVETIRSACSVCGYTDGSVTTNTYDKENRLIKEVVVNEYPYRTHTQTRQYMYHMGHQYMTLDRTEDSYKNGEKPWWTQDVYNYSFSDPCTKTVTSTDSYGKEQTHQESCCMMQGNTIQPPTCSQAGVMKESCEICGHDYGESSVNPHGHHWVQDETLQLYVCSTCGLQNINGADGSIVLEDLSVDGGTDYVAGYWNKTDITYILNVTLIKKNNSDNQIPAQGVKIQDDMKSIVRISKADVEAWAEANGYNFSDYDVRISFVPKNGSGELDYGLTFTDSVPKTLMQMQSAFVSAF